MDAAAGLHRFPLPRRGLLAGGLVGGYTLATGGATAQAIHTDDAGLDAGAVSIPVADGHIPGYAAMPAGPGPHPTVLVVEEIFGVHEYIRDVCRRLAHAGIGAVAPELYSRFPEFPSMTDPQRIVREVIMRAPDALVLSDGRAALDAAIATLGADPARLGVLGFCRGGRDAWLFAEHDERLRAAVAFYGPVRTPSTAIQPTDPLDAAARLRCPLLGLYGGLDTSIDGADVREAAARARAAGQTVDIVVYPDAPHGFHADYRPSYRAHDAADAWARALDWFRRYGL